MSVPVETDIDPELQDKTPAQSGQHGWDARVIRDIDRPVGDGAASLGPALMAALVCGMALILATCATPTPVRAIGLAIAVLAAGAAYQLITHPFRRRNRR